MAVNIIDINNATVPVSTIKFGQCFCYYREGSDDPIYFMMCNLSNVEKLCYDFETFQLSGYRNMFTGTEQVVPYNNVQFDVHMKKPITIYQNSVALQSGFLTILNGKMMIVGTVVNADTTSMALVDLNTGNVTFLDPETADSSSNMFVTGFNQSDIEVYFS